MSWNILENRGFHGVRARIYLNNQTQGLCNLVDNQNLRAVLRNETLPANLAEQFIFELIYHSRIDNGKALSILLQDERCVVRIQELEKCLRKGLTSMAEVLQQDERVKQDIKMCRTCSNNIGCYFCTNYEECAIGEGPRFCQECVSKDARHCLNCKDYLCPACYEEEHFERCEKCNGIVCIYEDCREDFLAVCVGCDQQKCKSCVEEDGEEWWDSDDMGIHCPTCRDESSSTVSSREDEG